KARLPEEARGAIAELQRTRTGFAIRPSSDAVELKQYIPILQTILEAVVEPSAHLASYRFASVPRTYTALQSDPNDWSNLMTAIVKVSPEALVEEIKRESGLQAVSAIETKTSAETPHSTEATWIVPHQAPEGQGFHRAMRPMPYVAQCPCLQPPPTLQALRLHRALLTRPP
ncbi:hypothetical protein K3495_g16929, partial [Podosphaera aphanis]